MRVDNSYRRIKKSVLPFLVDFISSSSIYLLGTISLFVADVVLARSFTKVQYGEFSFSKQTILIIMTISFLGMDSSVVRYIGRKRLYEFKWDTFLVKGVIILSTLSFIFTFSIGAYYSLDAYRSLSIFLSSVFGCIGLLIGALYRANTDYIKGLLSVHLWKFILAFGAVLNLVLGFRKLINPTTILLPVGFAIGCLISLALLIPYKIGNEKMEMKKILVEGTAFWANSGVLILTGFADILIITKYIGYEALANYTTGWNIIGVVYLLISTSLGYILVPPLLKGQISKKWMNYFSFTLLFVTLIIGIVLLLITPTLFTVLYGGKYEASRQLIFCFVLIGSVRLVYVVPNVIITAWAKTRIVQIYSILGLIGVVTNILIGVALVYKFGLIGAAISSLLGWIFRMILASVLTLFVHKSYRPAQNLILQ